MYTYPYPTPAHYAPYPQHAGPGPQPQPWGPAPAPWQHKLYTVRVVEHTGALIMWLQQTRTVTGTYPQCVAALRAAQSHNRAAGWWSIVSVLVLNWIALDANRKSRQALDALAARDGWPTADQTGSPAYGATAIAGPELSPVWQQRFAFYSRYGHPSASPHARAAVKALSFGERLRLTTNVVAFLVGPFYLVFKGMWRKGLVLILAALAVGILLATLDMSGNAVRAANLAFSSLTAMTANYAYFLHVTRRSTSWNPFEGLFGPTRR